MNSAAASPGPVVFPARRPAALVLPLALLTELGGVLCLRSGATIGWFILAAPALALLATGALFRPKLELTPEGIVQHQYPFSSLTRWDVIAGTGLVRAGNRRLLAYRLIPGIPPPRRQPAARMLRAAALPFDGGFFVDCLASRAEEVLDTVERYRHDPELRQSLRIQTS